MKIVDEYRNVHGERVTVSQSKDGRATLLQVWPSSGGDQTPPPSARWLYRHLAAAQHHGFATMAMRPISDKLDNSDRSDNPDT